MGAETAEGELCFFCEVVNTAGHVAEGVDNGVELVDDEVQGDYSHQDEMEPGEESEVSLPLAA